MTLTDPEVRGDVIRPALLVWPVREKIALRPREPTPLITLGDVMRGRRTRRSFGRPSLAMVVEVLRFATHTTEASKKKGVARYLAPSVGAGGLHGMDILILPRATHLLRYDRLNDSLEFLVVRNRSLLDAARSRAHELLPAARGYWIILVADQARYSAIYNEAESLIWRDAGALTQVVCMSAFAFGLECCPLGLHGDEVTASIDLSSDRIMACGMLAIGQATSPR